MCIRFIARIKIKIPKSIPPRLRSEIGFIYKVGLGRRIPKIVEKRYVSAALGTQVTRGPSDVEAKLSINAALRVHIKYYMVG